MKPTIFVPKHVLEHVPLLFPFSKEVPTGVTIVSVTRSCVVHKGVDSSPAAIFSGVPVIDAEASEVFQWVQTGVAGVQYLVQIVATLSNGGVLVRAGYLPVISFT